MNQTTRYKYNAQNVMNQMHYRHIQGPVIIEDNEFAAYISSFDNDNFPMEDHPFVKSQNQQFWDAITKYDMSHCTSCQGRWPTVINLHRDLALNLCPQGVYDKSNPKQFSDDNGMIPLTLVSGLLVELRYCMDVMPL